VPYLQPELVLFTDEWQSYLEVGKRYVAHHRIRHSEAIYVSGNVHTQTIEGFLEHEARHRGDLPLCLDPLAPGPPQRVRVALPRGRQPTRSIINSLLAKASE
jgi:hypothetical protein